MISYDVTELQTEPFVLKDYQQTLFFRLVDAITLEDKLVDLDPRIGRLSFVLTEIDVN